MDCSFLIERIVKVFYCKVINKVELIVRVSCLSWITEKGCRV